MSILRAGALFSSISILLWGSVSSAHQESVSILDKITQELSANGITLQIADDDLASLDSKWLAQFDQLLVPEILKRGSIYPTVKISNYGGSAFGFRDAAGLTFSMREDFSFLSQLFPLFDQLQQLQTTTQKRVIYREGNGFIYDIQAEVASLLANRDRYALLGPAISVLEFSDSAYDSANYLDFPDNFFVLHNARFIARPDSLAGTPHLEGILKNGIDFMTDYSAQQAQLTKEKINLLINFSLKDKVGAETPHGISLEDYVGSNTTVSHVRLALVLAQNLSTAFANVDPDATHTITITRWGYEGYTRESIGDKLTTDLTLVADAADRNSTFDSMNSMFLDIQAEAELTKAIELPIIIETTDNDWMVARGPNVYNHYAFERIRRYQDMIRAKKDSIQKVQLANRNAFERGILFISKMPSKDGTDPELADLINQISLRVAL